MPAEPQHDNRQFGRLRTEFFQQLHASFRAAVLEADRDPVAGKRVTQFLGPGGPVLANPLHRLEAASTPAAPLNQEPGDRLVELFVRALYGARDPMVELAPRDRVEDRPCGVPLAPANSRYLRHRPIDFADPRQYLD